MDTSINESNPSGEASATTEEDHTPPSAFDLLAPADGATVGTATTLVWQASSDSGSGLDHYEVWMNDLYMDSTSDTSYGVSTLSEGPYQWYVVAFDAAGNSRQSTSTFTFDVDDGWPDLGDVNGDWYVDIIDALQVARYDAGLSPDPFHESAGDVKGCDGVINIIDALAIARYDAGLISAFECA